MAIREHKEKIKFVEEHDKNLLMHITNLNPSCNMTI